MKKLIENEAEWERIKDTVERGDRSSLHCSVATVNEDGTPLVTPIGSLILDAGRTGRYLEIFASGLGRNLDRDPRFTLLAVDSSVDLWFPSMVDGRFHSDPAVRLSGTASRRRRARPGEAEECLEFAAPLKGLKGYDLLWGNGGGWVRELSFEHVLPVRIGAMTGTVGP